MQQYDIKRKLKAETTPETIARQMQEEFGTSESRNGRAVTSYGALRKLECWLGEKGRLCVEAESNTGVGNETAADTIAKYNRFLEKVTGYNSKERRKNAMKNK